MLIIDKYIFFLNPWSFSYVATCIFCFNVLLLLTNVDMTFELSLIRKKHNNQSSSSSCRLFPNRAQQSLKLLIVGHLTYSPFLRSLCLLTLLSIEPSPDLGVLVFGMAAEQAHSDRPVSIWRGLSVVLDEDLFSTGRAGPTPEGDIPPKWRTWVVCCVPQFSNACCLISLCFSSHYVWTLLSLMLLGDRDTLKFHSGDPRLEVFCLFLV